MCGFTKVSRIEEEKEEGMRKKRVSLKLVCWRSCGRTGEEK